MCSSNVNNKIRIKKKFEISHACKSNADAPTFNDILPCRNKKYNRKSIAEY